MGGTITVDMARTVEVLQFSVSDTGPGIPEDDLERVFERFFRSDPSRSRGHVPGLGLGLAIASWVVKEHHGTIRVSNRREGGATFTVTLPLAKTAEHLT
jgi:signal transduction histidine kinase